MKNSKIGSGLILVVVIMVLAGISCTNYTIPGKKSGETTVNSCEVCHTDYERLMAVYTPDTGSPVAGYEGVAPHIEPYDRVYLGGEGYEAFKTSPHYSVGCTGCHNGDGKSEDKDEAHSGEFINHPSMHYENKCGTCHKEITGYFTTSLHQGTGLKRNVALRSGLNGPEESDQLPAHQIEGYNNNCAICHGTCGTCHVVRPPMGGGGLANGHSFNKTPDMNDVCITCHVSTVGDAYLGSVPGTQPDVHLTEEGFECLNCHDSQELHGDGQPVEQRYAYSELPRCEDCHEGIGKANPFHSMHIDDFNCQVCHSQDFNNCGSCHVNGEGARIPSYQGFKIALNPLPDVKEGYKFALVRQTTAAPDNWKEYGVEAYSDFDVLPVYNYTTPHNILRWTSRTNQSGSCSINCHIRQEGETLINKELFLFTSDLKEDWEISSTGHIAVDGQLPSSWTE